MKKILLLLLLLINCKKDSENSNEFLLPYLYGTSNFNIEQIAYANAKRLVSPLGQFHYRGLYSPEGVSRGGANQFHFGEEGDATFKTGTYLSALAWKYKNNPNDDVLSQIDKSLAYYEGMQDRLNGWIGRNYVIDKAYQQFIDCEKNGNYTGSDVSVSCGTYRYKQFTIDGNVYWLRYDNSIDAITHTLMGLHWTARHVPTMQPRAVAIMKKLLVYYRSVNWQIRDDAGTRLRYGDHRPTLNPVAWTNEAILLFWSGEPFKDGSYIATIANNIITYDGLIVEKEDRNFFNDLMLVKNFHVLHDLGYETKAGIGRLYNQHKNEYYFLTYSIYKIVYNDYNVVHVKDLSNWSLFNYHCAGDVQVDYIVPLDSRKTYSRWEFSPYRLCVAKIPSQDLSGNTDFLEAYHIF